MCSVWWHFLCFLIAQPLGWAITTFGLCDLPAPGSSLHLTHCSCVTKLNSDHFLLIGEVLLTKYSIPQHWPVQVYRFFRSSDHWPVTLGLQYRCTVTKRVTHPIFRWLFSVTFGFLFINMTFCFSDGFVFFTIAIKFNVDLKKVGLLGQS